MGSQRSLVLCADLAPGVVADLRLAESDFQFLDVACDSLLGLAVKITLEQPDIVLIPGRWLSAKGFGILVELQALKHDLAVAVVETDLDISTIPVGLALGLRGVLNPDSPARVLIEALERIRAGEVWIRRHQLVEALRRLAGDSLKSDAAMWDKLPALTEREHATLDRLLHGLSNQGIADDLGISIETVKVHLRHVFSKLGVHRRAQLLSSGFRTTTHDLH